MAKSIDRKTVDRLVVDTQELGTTLSVPLGGPVLAGGLTYIASSSGRLDRGVTSDSVTTGEAPQLYLILELK